MTTADTRPIAQSHGEDKLETMKASSDDASCACCTNDNTNDQCDDEHDKSIQTWAAHADMENGLVEISSPSAEIIIPQLFDYALAVAECCATLPLSPRRQLAAIYAEEDPDDQYWYCHPEESKGSRRYYGYDKVIPLGEYLEAVNRNNTEEETIISSDDDTIVSMERWWECCHDSTTRSGTVVPSEWGDDQSCAKPASGEMVIGEQLKAQDIMHSHDNQLRGNVRKAQGSVKIKRKCEFRKGTKSSSKMRKVTGTASQSGGDSDAPKEKTWEGTHRKIQDIKLSRHNIMSSAITPEKPRTATMNGKNKSSPTPPILPKGIVDIDRSNCRCCRAGELSNNGEKSSSLLALRLVTWNWQQGSGHELLRDERLTETLWLKLSSMPTNKSKTTCNINSNRQHSMIMSSSAVEDHINYMDRQTNHITSELRTHLMDWMVGLAENLCLGRATLYLAVTAFDRALACLRVREKRRDGKAITSADWEQLLCTCMFIASKLEEIDINTPAAEDFVQICDNVRNKTQIFDMEAYLCTTLKFNFNFKTPCHYADRFIRASHASSGSAVPCMCVSASAAQGGIMLRHTTANDVLEQLVYYLLDLALLEFGLFVSTRPSHLAASAVYLCRATLGIRDSEPIIMSDNLNSNSDTSLTLQSMMSEGREKRFWSKTLAYYTSYHMKDLEHTVKALRILHAGAACLGNVYRKHVGSRQPGSIAHRAALLHESDLGFD